MGSPRLAIIIPAYREEETIAQVVCGASSHAAVIVVDDCSPDETALRARDAGATVVRNKVNLGYDGALSAGFAAAADGGFTHVVTLDADGEHDPRLIAAFRAVLLDRGMPLALGVRPRKQRLAEIIMGFVIRLRFGVRDILCGMKGYDMALWHRNGGFDHCQSIGTELAINALKAGIPFEEIRVGGTPRAGAPRFDRRLRANLRILRALWRTLGAADNPLGSPVP